MSQGQRDRAMGGFRAGKYQVLVATDIAARGIDVAHISHVINFDIPETLDTYTHRIGRTGRSERSGKACTLFSSQDLPLVHALERKLGKAIKRCDLPEIDLQDLPVEETIHRNGRATPHPSRHEAHGGHPKGQPRHHSASRHGEEAGPANRRRRRRRRSVRMS
jgi:ATP-dependent RNA helicase RhlE